MSAKKGLIACTAFLCALAGVIWGGEKETGKSTEQILQTVIKRAEKKLSALGLTSQQKEQLAMMAQLYKPQLKESVLQMKSDWQTLVRSVKKPDSTAADIRSAAMQMREGFTTRGMLINAMASEIRVILTTGQIAMVQDGMDSIRAKKDQILQVIQKEKTVQTPAGSAEILANLFASRKLSGKNAAPQLANALNLEFDQIQKIIEILLNNKKDILTCTANVIEGHSNFIEVSLSPSSKENEISIAADRLCRSLAETALLVDTLQQQIKPVFTSQQLEQLQQALKLQREHTGQIIRQLLEESEGF